MQLVKLALLSVVALGQDIYIDVTKEQAKPFNPPNVTNVVTGGALGSSQPKSSVLLVAKQVEASDKGSLVVSLKIVNVTNQPVSIPVGVAAPSVPERSAKVLHYRTMLVEFKEEEGDYVTIRPVELVGSQKVKGSLRTLGPGATLHIRLETTVAQSRFPTRVSARILAFDVELLPSQEGYSRSNTVVPRLRSTSEYMAVARLPENK